VSDGCFVNRENTVIKLEYGKRIALEIISEISANRGYYSA
jgi:hypothetical protein